MIKISRQTDYALQFIISLSKLKEGEVLSVRAFSKKSTISFLFLQKIVRELRRAGIVESVKGQSGGYKLKRSPREISLKDVVDAVDGPYSMCDCTRENSECGSEDRCSIAPVMRSIHKQIIGMMDKISIAEAEALVN